MAAVATVDRVGHLAERRTVGGLVGDVKPVDVEMDHLVDEGVFEGCLLHVEAVADADGIFFRGGAAAGTVTWIAQFAEAAARVKHPDRHPRKGAGKNRPVEFLEFLLQKLKRRSHSGQS